MVRTFFLCYTKDFFQPSFLEHYPFNVVSAIFCEKPSESNWCNYLDLVYWLTFLSLCSSKAYQFSFTLCTKKI